MPRIHVLPELLVRQIAAGEVVERPASVVKELVENSLDAGARKIEIFLEGGGLASITVLDDGEGMDPQDAVLAFERHATSKIKNSEDLERIASLGFRGEALASIASVAKVRLVSAREGAESGSEVVVEGGTRAEIRPGPARRGTRIEVRDVFFNTPARRKFMRSPQAEQRRIAAALMGLALAHPKVHFVLRGEKRVLLDAPPAAGLRERAAQVLGRDAMEGFVPFSLRDGMALAEGLLSSPQKPFRSREMQFFFVNGRPVQDRLLAGAAARAWPAMPSGSYPGFLIFMTLPPDAVDVNVHPAKTEVRFRDASLIFRLLQTAVERTLGTRSALGPASFAGSASGLSISRAMPLPPAPMPVREAQAMLASAVRERAAALPRESEPAESEVHFARPAPQPLAQYAGTYILAQDSGGLLLVDQHVAHERALYEKILSAFQGGALHRQALLIPVDVELPASMDAADAALLALLARMGFEAEPFGAGTLRLRAVPALCAEADLSALVLDLAAKAGEAAETREGRMHPALDAMFASMACRSAVVKNTPLSMEKMREILSQWSRTANPSVCPHGRPVALRYALEEIERDFGRR